MSYRIGPGLVEFEKDAILPPVMQRTQRGPGLVEFEKDAIFNYK